MKGIRCSVNGECFDRYVNGKLENPEQVIECIKIEPIKGTNLLAATPAKDTDVYWTDKGGNPHKAALLAGQAFAVEKRFVV